MKQYLMVFQNFDYRGSSISDGLTFMAEEANYEKVAETIWGRFGKASYQRGLAGGMPDFVELYNLSDDKPIRWHPK